MMITEVVLESLERIILSVEQISWKEPNQQHINLPLNTFCLMLSAPNPLLSTEDVVL